MAARRRFELRNVRLLAARELSDAWSNRWFLLYSTVFAGLALAMSWLSAAGLARAGISDLGRTAASLIHLVVLVVPLMGLTLGAGAIAAERESGSLQALLGQPISRAELVLGKLTGLAAAVTASLLLGFGVAAWVIATRVSAGDLLAFLAFLALAVLVATASLSLGLLISASVDRASVATGSSLFVWLVLVLLGDIGILGTSLVMRLDARQLLWGALINPLQEFKIAALLVLRGGLDVIGPSGLYAVRTFGDGLLPLLAGLLVLWTVVPLLGTLLVMGRRGAL